MMAASMAALKVDELVGVKAVKKAEKSGTAKEMQMVDLKAA